MSSLHRTNELCYPEEEKLGYSAHYIGFGVLLYKNDTPYMQLATANEMHEYILEEEGGYHYEKWV